MSINKELKEELTTEVAVVSLGDLTVIPDMQMRSVMNSEIVTQYAECVDNLPPVDVFEVNHENGDTDWYLVDGFHRYFAHEEAGKEEITVLLRRDRTYSEAFNFAMSANYKNGQQPSSEDRKRCLGMIMEEYAEEIGMDSKKVVPLMVEIGIPKSPAARYSKEVRQQLDTRRDRKILELLEEGMSQRKIAEVVGCGKDIVTRIKKGLDSDVRNKPVSQIGQPESPTDSIDPDDLFDDETEDSPSKSSTEAWDSIHAENEQARLERQAKKEAQGSSGSNTTTTGSESSNEAQGISGSNTTTTGTIDTNLESANRALAYVEAFIDSKAFENLEFSTRLERIYRKYYTN